MDENKKSAFVLEGALLVSSYELLLSKRKCIHTHTPIKLGNYKDRVRKVQGTTESESKRDRVWQGKSIFHHKSNILFERTTKTSLNNTVLL